MQSSKARAATYFSMDTNIPLKSSNKKANYISTATNEAILFKNCFLNQPIS